MWKDEEDKNGEKLCGIARAWKGGGWAESSIYPLDLAAGHSSD